MELRSGVELECGWQSPCRWRGKSTSGLAPWLFVRSVDPVVVVERPGVGLAPLLFVHSVDPWNRLGRFRTCALGEALEYERGSRLRLAQGCGWKWGWVLACERAWVWEEGTVLVA